MIQIVVMLLEKGAGYEYKQRLAEMENNQNQIPDPEDMEEDEEQELVVERKVAINSPIHWAAYKVRLDFSCPFLGPPLIPNCSTRIS